MKRIEIKWLKMFNSLIYMALSMLGFSMSSCGGIGSMYGTPEADFIIRGKVTDKRTNQPIENVEVEVSGDWNKTSTDANGKYKITVNDFPESQTFPVRFRDVDGNLNGLYMDLDTIVEFKDPEFTGGKGNWYEGKTTKEFNIQLDPKE